MLYRAIAYALPEGTTPESLSAQDLNNLNISADYVDGEFIISINGLPVSKEELMTAKNV